MSVPKQRHSNRRQARGRTRYVKKPKNLSVCPKCSAPALSHRACPKCGSYRGREYGKSVKPLSSKTTKTQKKPVSPKKKAPKKSVSPKK